MHRAGGGYGSECYSWKGEKTTVAVDICAELSKLGFRNRGVKNGSGLYVISKTTMPATLVEVCFVDSRSDYELYKKLSANKIAKAIADGFAQYKAIYKKALTISVNCDIWKLNIIFRNLKKVAAV